MGSMGVIPDASTWPDQDLVFWSVGLEPELLVEGYAAGAFPMPTGELAETGDPLIGWYSPVARGILPLDALRVTRSLRKSARHYRLSIDHCFDQVVERCADPNRSGGWIDDEIKRVYGELHRLGLAHSVETWDAAGRLVGGLYGVGLGGLFAGESMFHDPEHGRDASKVALIALVELLGRDGHRRLLDVQWQTPHLSGLGVVEVSRADYLNRLGRALRMPSPQWQLPQV
ncbi:leucyl/phenylalanyl-tRNA--protein transferase [Naumannella halotolerans]|uniref:Leucyl/phenylalanyl-tRNA--protein transferase n=1 Tax=Naumannella halotolerans TaxID=993414 RepID=A0A4R7IYU4_9ACTN|nr:leucyl/phenylalanyl-tRNA--protein transferase [Naumannella halotolerans]